jgi:NAD kinase
MANTLPRVVIVTRPSDYEALLVRHGTHEQARFHLATRGQSLEDVERRHQKHAAALRAVSQAIPISWRRSFVLRSDLSRFVFEPSDLVVTVGQDGLVANVAKYLDTQLVVGVNPDPSSYDGVLAKHEAGECERLFQLAVRADVAVEARTTVEVTLDDGQHLRALNELFLGHGSHQSARYLIATSGKSERHSSSGIIVATGTGSTGWACSVRRERRTDIVLPAPTDPRLVFFVREAFPSRASATALTEGSIVEPGGDGDGSDALEVVSQMNEGGVIFGDGMEEDRIRFDWGRRATVRIAKEQLRLV